MRWFSRMPQLVIVAIGVLYLVIVAMLLPDRVRLPVEGDAAAYNNAAIHLATEGFYSQDGKVPLVEREPGQSVFLALVYSLAGADNRWAAFTMQALFYLVASAFFCREMASVTSRRIAILCFAFLLTLPSALHVVLSFLRESLALSLFLLFAACFLRLQRGQRLSAAAAAGVLLGALAVTYAPYLLFPLFLLPLRALLGIRWGQYGVLLVCFGLVVSLWGIRNERIRGRPCLTGCTRSAEFWYVRGEQAEKLRGFEPLKCLWSEYVSRDWTGRSEVCSYNHVRNTHWPQGFTGAEEDLQAGWYGVGKILRYFPHYLWFSLFEVLELHLPYVNGWGRTYNILAAIGSLVLYVGCAFAGRLMAARRTLILVWIPLYTILLFILTDATPRYLMPTIFCYAAFAAVGWDRVIGRRFVSS